MGTVWGSQHTSKKKRILCEHTWWKAFFSKLIIFSEENRNVLPGGLGTRWCPPPSLFITLSSLCIHHFLPRSIKSPRLSPACLMPVWHIPHFRALPVQRAGLNKRWSNVSIDCWLWTSLYSIYLLKPLTPNTADASALPGWSLKCFLHVKKTSCPI